MFCACCQAADEGAERVFEASELFSKFPGRSGVSREDAPDAAGTPRVVEDVGEAASVRSPRDVLHERVLNFVRQAAQGRGVELVRAKRGSAELERAEAMVAFSRDLRSLRLTVDGRSIDVPMSAVQGAHTTDSSGGSAALGRRLLEGLPEPDLQRLIVIKYKAPGGEVMSMNLLELTPYSRDDFLKCLYILAKRATAGTPDPKSP
mmetsp:Transcript_115120/g.332574  ORF Transcript_115120/g.332574 Transcript_115120/m.332574 type:complete len:205 (+) Transcript_115120:74-688(+)